MKISVKNSIGVCAFDYWRWNSLWSNTRFPHASPIQKYRWGWWSKARLRLFGQICWAKGVDDRGARLEEKGKTTENILRSSEGQPGGGRDRRGCWGKWFAVATPKGTRGKEMHIYTYILTWPEHASFKMYVFTCVMIKIIIIKNEDWKFYSLLTFTGKNVSTPSVFSALI